MKDLLIVINTCENYLKYNKDSLLKQIKESGLQNIIIISGQENKEEINYLDNIKLIKVKYTGINHTSAIYISENYNEFNNYKYFMLLPDTIHIGKNFKSNIVKYYKKYLQNNNIKCFGFINPTIRPSMDMGIFSIEHLKNMSIYFSKIKTFDVSKNNLLKLKKLLIYDENTIFGKPICKKGTNYKVSLKDEEKIFLCNDKKEIIETRISDYINQVYFPQLDLYKFQRNFKGPNNKLILDYNVE